MKAIGSDAAVDGEGEEDMPFRLGHIQKTRFTPFKMYLKFDPEKGFSLAPPPEQKIFEDMRQLLLKYYRNFSSPIQTKFVEIVKTELDMNKTKVINMIEKGDDIYWHSLKERKFNRITYTPVFHEDDIDH